MKGRQHSAENLDFQLCIGVKFCSYVIQPPQFRPKLSVGIKHDMSNPPDFLLENQGTRMI